jgi:3-carboxy-cis,cis-muconate cycloisomerase
MLGRTLLQPAIPITFGLKAAQWLAAGLEARGFIAGAKAAALVPQCGGAAGTLGSLGDKGIEVARRIGTYLPGLHAPRALLPWQTRRGALVALCAAIGIAAGVCGKIARDVSLMMQFEVAEAFEPIEEGRGGSSALPHKRNPVRSMQILACAAQIGPLVGQMLAGLPQEHERALGAWQAEWPVVPQIFKLASGALANAAALLEGLTVDAARMRSNLEALKGLPFAEAFSVALAPKLGRDEAHELVEAASRKVPDSGKTLAELLAADPRVGRHVTLQELAAIGDPHRALGATGAFIDEVLGLWDAVA